jgi:hypothetical protein
MNTSKSGKSKSQEILQMLNLIEDLKQLEKVFKEKATKNEYYLDLFEEYLKLKDDYEPELIENKTHEDILKEWAKKRSINDLSKIKQRLYEKIVEVLPMMNKEVAWRKRFEKKIDEAEALYDLNLFKQAYEHLKEAKELISLSSKYPHLPQKDMFMIHRYYNLKWMILFNYKPQNKKDNLPELAQEIVDLLDIIIPRIETRKLYNPSQLDKILNFKNSEIYLYRVLTQITENVKGYESKLKFLDEAMELVFNQPDVIFSLTNWNEAHYGKLEEDTQIYRIQNVFYCFLFLEKVFTYIQSNPFGMEHKIEFDFIKYNNLIRHGKYGLNTYNQALNTFILFKISEIELGLNIKGNNTEQLKAYYKQFQQFLFTPEKMEDIVMRIELNNILISFVLANSEKQYGEVYNELLEGLEKQRFPDKYRPSLRFLKLICSLEADLKITDYYNFKIREDSNEAEFLKLTKNLFENSFFKDSGIRAYRLQYFKPNVEILEKLKEEAKINNPFHQAILSWFEKHRA